MVPPRPNGRGRPNTLLGSILALFLTALTGGPIHAQITCSGSNCGLIPLTPEEYNAMFVELQNQYSNELFRNIAETLVMANVAGPQIGTVNLSRMTTGGYLGAGYKENEDVDINIPNVGVIEDMPSAGAALSGGVFVGVNLGWVLGDRYDPFAAPETTAELSASGSGTDNDATKTDSRSASRSSRKTPPFWSPARFDIYLGGLDHRERLDGQLNSDAIIDGKFVSQRFMLRYHLVEGNEIAGGPLLRFHGVSLGIGYATSNQRLTYLAENSTLTTSLQEGVNLDWAAQDQIFYDNNVKSVPIEINTGVQLLYLFNLTLGAGYVRSSGDTRFILTRNGPVVIRQAGELPAIDDEFLQNFPAGTIPPDLTALISGGTATAANLSLSLFERSRVPRVLYYWKGGLEFNFWVLKLGIEAITTGRNYGASVGLRIEI
ncbi:MAG: hypothetical protein NXI24_07965 [bacterium]|nr:hypothetical protein [bacterium]